MAGRGMIDPRTDAELAATFGTRAVAPAAPVAVHVVAAPAAPVATGGFSRAGVVALPTMQTRAGVQGGYGVPAAAPVAAAVRLTMPAATPAPVKQVPGAVYAAVAGKDGKLHAGPQIKGGIDHSPQASPYISVADLDGQQPTGTMVDQQMALTPQDRLTAAVNSILGQGHASLNQLKAVAAITPAAPRAGTTKDAILGQAAQGAQEMFASTYKQAATDADKAKAANSYLQYLAQISSGYNPLAAAQAQLLDQGQE